MKYIKITGLCLVAVCVVSMLAAGSAFAETKPYFEQCLKVEEAKTGTFEDAGCSIKGGTAEFIPVIEGAVSSSEPKCRLVQEVGKGNYEDSNCAKKAPVGTAAEYIKIQPEEDTFSATGGSGLLETVGGKTVTCTSNSARGLIAGPKNVEKARVTFFGCEETEKKVKCKTSGKAEGEVVTEGLKGKIGYLEKSVPKVGLQLEPEKGRAELFAELLCPSTILKIKVKGSVIGEVGPLNTMGKTGTLKYELTKKGKQKWTSLEGEAEDILESMFTGGSVEKSAISGEDTITFHVTTQISA